MKKLTLCRAVLTGWIAVAVSVSACGQLAPRYSPGAREKIREARERNIRKGQTGMVLDGLRPEAVWKHFDKIRSIPHCSGREQALAHYVMDFGKLHGCEVRKDAYGNVLVVVPASAGAEKAPVVVIQTHIDMVCEKNDGVKHDFATESLVLELTDGWLTANGTTLGADNGIGVACALALAEAQDVRHGTLELLFTVEEEIGLIGAGRLEPGFVTGRTLLNLDSEELGTICIGCAGGSSTVISLPAGREPVPGGAQMIAVNVRGLRGGHSGIDIGKRRGNAIKILAQVLSRLEAIEECRVVTVSGGNKMNAIPREAGALLAVTDTGAGGRVKDLVRQAAARFDKDLGAREPGLAISTTDAGAGTGLMLDLNSNRRLVTLLLAVPHGVHTVSRDIRGLVETSNNLATVAMDGDTIRVGSMARSSSRQALLAMEERVVMAGEQSGGSVETGERYPGWQPDLSSPLLAIVSQAYLSVTGTKPEAKAIHAGLECGIISERFAGIDMVSIGPTIEAPHSPGERVEIASVATFWRVLVEIVERL